MRPDNRKSASGVVRADGPDFRSTGPASPVPAFQNMSTDVAYVGREECSIITTSSGPSSTRAWAESESGSVCQRSQVAFAFSNMLTRRFRRRPTGVWLVATGWDSP